MTTIEVHSRTQRIIVNPNRSISIVNAGPVGPPGPQGEPGATGSFYHHLQTDLLADWPVPHNLGYKPALGECKDDAGTRFRPGVEHVDDNNLILHFSGPCRGTADFS